MHHAPDTRHTTRVHRRPWDRSPASHTGPFALVSLALGLLVAATLASCGGGGSDGGAAATAPDPAPTTGAIAITMVTSGAELDPDGYTVHIDGGAAQAIATTGSLVVASLEAGTHAVALEGVAANCMVTGGVKQTVSVTAGDTTAVAYTITCEAVTGALTVITTTDNAAIDPDGYEVILADSTTVPGGSNYSIWGDSTVGRVGTQGSTTFTGLQPGNYVILLGGQSDGCGVASGPPLIIPVTAGDTTSVNYTVDCASPVSFGELEIQTNTSGFNFDPDGYAFSVTFSEEQAIGTHDAVTITRSAGPGSAVVWLRGVAPNCTVDGTNVHVADVLQGTTNTVVFNVTCGSDP